MRKAVQSTQVNVVFVADQDARKLVTIREDDMLWGYFKGFIKEEPEFEEGQFVRLYIPIQTTDQEVVKAIDWLTNKKCAVRKMPRQRIKAPTVPVAKAEVKPLRQVVDEHLTEVFNRVYGENSALLNVFNKAKTEILEKAGV